MAVALKAALSDAAKKFVEKEIEASWREARLLLAHALGVSYEEIVFETIQTLSEKQSILFDQYVLRRLNSEPLSKIVGIREFWGKSFYVTKDTLDPRPDSETLIEGVLDLFPDRNQPLKVLDLGTGTGCLLLSVLGEYPQATGVGIDLSYNALKIAQKNVFHHKLEDRCVLVNGSWTEAVFDKFDVILSNPPYIGEDESLSETVALYDPPMALYAGKDGLSCYRQLAACVGKQLSSTGRVILEIGCGQSDNVKSIFNKQGFSLIQERYDLSGIPRALVFYL
jgi:release factor glutamine methyltransferase